MSSTSGWISRGSAAGTLLMTLMDAAQLAAQQVQRAQAVEDLEHEAEHQAGGGEAEAEETG